MAEKHPRPTACIGLALSILLLCNGCMTQFHSSSFDVKPKPASSVSGTNFRVQAVSDDEHDHEFESHLRTELEKLEQGQNASLPAVPYSVDLRYLGHEETSDTTKMLTGLLYICSCFVLPHWDTTTHKWEISTALPGETGSFRGERSSTDVISWFMLPLGMRDFFSSGGTGGGSPSLSESMAKAIFDSLTQARYDKAVSAMRLKAKQRLLGGKRLSESEERLLEDDTSLDILVARAKHPANKNSGLSALARIDDPETLADIALHSAVPEIRQAAACRVSGLPESRFAQLAAHSADAVVAETFLERISDDALLRHVAQTSSSPETQSAAIGRIGQESVLADLAKSPEGSLSLKCLAVGRIGTEFLLADVAAHAPDAGVRKAAIGKIDAPAVLLASVLRDENPKNRLAALARTDHPKALAAIMLKSGDAAVRRETIRKITDPAVLKEVVAKDADEAVRMAALERSEDQEVFRMAAETDSSPAVRAAAVAKLSDPAMLARLAETGAHEEIRTQAARKTVDSIVDIADPADLAQIVASSRHEEIRLAALERITDAAVICGIAESDASARVRCAAVAKTGDQEILARIARADPDPKVRLQAVRNLRDTDCLAAVARGDADLSVRLEALEKTGDMEAIKAVATGDKSSVARAAAVAKVDDPVLLASIAKQDADASVRERAAARLEDKKKENARALGKGTMPGAAKTFTLPGGATMEMVWCPAGRFMMGSPYGEAGRSEVETQHQVTLTRGFWMAKTEVTRKQWRSVMGTNPPGDGGDDLPAANVSWEDCEEFCLRAGMRLPTEAEWEYACRAGNGGPLAGNGHPDEMGWHAGNSGRVTHPAGQKQANVWGLFDMHGNVAEWCADWHGKYPGGAVTDPAGALSGEFRVVRGGGCGDNVQSCWSASRAWNFPGVRRGDLGFRPVVRQN